MANHIFNKENMFSGKSKCDREIHEGDHEDEAFILFIYFFN